MNRSEYKKIRHAYNFEKGPFKIEKIKEAKMKYFIQAYIPVVEVDEDTEMFDSFIDAVEAMRELEAIQTENKYEIEEYEKEVDNGNNIGNKLSEDETVQDNPVLPADQSILQTVIQEIGAGAFTLVNSE